MVDLVCDWNVLYEAPSNQILRNRRAFYGLKRKAKETVEQWLKRIQSSIRCCEFPTIIEFLLIDRFVCGLNRNELKIMRCVQGWTVKQLIDMFSIQNIVNDTPESNFADSEYIVPNQMLTADLIKSEPVCYYFHLFLFSLSMDQEGGRVNRISLIYKLITG